MSQHLFIPIAFEFRPVRVQWSLGPPPDDCLYSDCEERLKGRPAYLYGMILKSHPMPSDAWEMRDQFFRVKRGDTGAWLNFLNKWGAWANPPLGPVTPGILWDKQEEFRRALTGPAVSWLTADARNGMTLRFAQPRAEYPHHLLRLRTIEEAIRMTITIDLMRKIKFRLCARPDCREPFSLTRKYPRPKKYCCQACAHLSAVRRQRRKARKP